MSAISARQRGDEFQALMFWLAACRLREDGSNVVRVVFEQGPLGFDDYRIHYDPPLPTDHHGLRVEAECRQDKWHAASGTFGWKDLIEHDFIRAKTSVLERLHGAIKWAADEGIVATFVFETNWQVRHGDLLEAMMDNGGSGHLRLDVLAEGKTDASASGLARRTWRDHLNLADDDALFHILKHIRIRQQPAPLDTLRQHVRTALRAAGLKPAPDTQIAPGLSELVWTLFDRGDVDFDRARFTAMCRLYGLLEEPCMSPEQLRIGVRSMQRPGDTEVEDNADRVLSLLEWFDGRFLRRADDWKSEILPRLNSFIAEARAEKRPLRLVFGAHYAIAFAVGTLLDARCGVAVEILQFSRGFGLVGWRPGVEVAQAPLPRPTFEIIPIAEKGTEAALAIGLTHAVQDEVAAYLSSSVPSVGQMVLAALPDGSGQNSVQCGAHAALLADSIIAKIKSIRAGGATGRLHLFVSGPNAVAFLLGQQHHALGPCRFYEYDFTRQRHGTYEPFVDFD